MKQTKLQVIIIAGQMEMSWDGEVIYRGVTLDALAATRHISDWSHLDFSASAAIWKYRQELTA